MPLVLFKAVVMPTHSQLMTPVTLKVWGSTRMF